MSASRAGHRLRRLDPQGQGRAGYQQRAGGDAGGLVAATALGGQGLLEARQHQAAHAPRGEQHLRRLLVSQMHDGAEDGVEGGIEVFAEILG